jgi:hypothetical protein
MGYSERLPTLLTPLAERTCFSQVMFAPDDVEVVAIMRSFAASVGLEYGVDVVAKLALDVKVIQKDSVRRRLVYSIVNNYTKRRLNDVNVHA